MKSPKKKGRQKKLHKKWLYKYRLVVLNEDTFEEQLSFKLNRLNVFVVGTLFTVFLIAGTTVLIAFTPLREYIPGYSSVKLKKEANRLAIQSDSLKTELAINDEYLSSIRKMLTGEVEIHNVDRDSLAEQIRQVPENIDFPSNKSDSLLRQEVAMEDKYNLSGNTGNSVDFVLFPPISGTISDGYNIKDKHYGVDIVGPENAPVKSVAAGVVIFAEWTAATGYVMIIEHNNGLISVYKHNAALSKEQGDPVKSGEVIAAVGNTGELTTGPHLHFELWNNGYPIDPKLYIDFK